MIKTLGLTGCGGLLMAMAVFAVTRPAATPPILAATDPAPTLTPDPFIENWISAAIPLALKNAELTPVFAAAMGPSRSREDSETAKVAVAVARNDVPQTVGTTVSVRRHRDICERNGMHKVKHGRYGWRCRK